MTYPTYRCYNCGTMISAQPCFQCENMKNLRRAAEAQEEANRRARDAENREWHRRNQEWLDDHDYRYVSDDEARITHPWFYEDERRASRALPQLNSLPLPPLDEFSLLPIDELISLHDRLKKQAEILESKTGKRVISKKLLTLSEGPGGLFIFSDNSRQVENLPEEENEQSHSVDSSTSSSDDFSQFIKDIPRRSAEVLAKKHPQFFSMPTPEMTVDQILDLMAKGTALKEQWEKNQVEQSPVQTQVHSPKVDAGVGVRERLRKMREAKIYKN